MKSFVTDDGERLHVSVRGDGPPLVLLHQWAADHLSWGDLPLVLAEHYTVYAWNARGHGHGPRQGRETPTVGRMARDLLQLFDHFQLERPAVVGHSMGALTLWELIRQAGTERLGPLCIIDQSPRLMTGPDWPYGIYGNFPPERHQAFLSALTVDFAETVLRLVADGLNPRATEQYLKNSRGIQHLREKLGRVDHQAASAIWASLIAGDWRPVLPTIDRPTLLIYGAESNYYGPATAAWVHAQIPGSILHLYDKADHSPHMSQRARFLEDLRRFLGQEA